MLCAVAMLSACERDPARKGLVAPDGRAPQATADREGDGGALADLFARPFVAIRDDCDPTDPGWLPTGGCLLKRGDVSLAEFNAELNSPLSPTTVIGHMSWRMDPTYLDVREGHTVQVRNEGGRTHTFTRVAAFGGGRVPPLARGLLPAPECANAVNIPSGGSTELSGLAAGTYHYQCCIHSWMRAIVKVKSD